MSLLCYMDCFVLSATLRCNSWSQSLNVVAKCYWVRNWVNLMHFLNKPDHELLLLLLTATTTAIIVITTSKLDWLLLSLTKQIVVVLLVTTVRIRGILTTKNKKKKHKQLAFLPITAALTGRSRQQQLIYNRWVVALSSKPLVQDRRDRLVGTF